MIVSSVTSQLSFQNNSRLSTGSLQSFKEEIQSALSDASLNLYSLCKERNSSIDYATFMTTVGAVAISTISDTIYKSLLNIIDDKTLPKDLQANITKIIDLYQEKIQLINSLDSYTEESWTRQSDEINAQATDVANTTQQSFANTSVVLTLAWLAMYMHDADYLFAKTITLYADMMQEVANDLNSLVTLFSTLNTIYSAALSAANFDATSQETPVTPISIIQWNDPITSTDQFYEYLGDALNGVPADGETPAYAPTLDSHDYAMGTDTILAGPESLILYFNPAILPPIFYQFSSVTNVDGKYGYTKSDIQSCIDYISKRTMLVLPTVDLTTTFGTNPYNSTGVQSALSMAQQTGNNVESEISGTSSILEILSSNAQNIQKPFSNIITAMSSLMNSY